MKKILMMMIAPLLLAIPCYALAAGPTVGEDVTFDGSRQEHVSESSGSTDTDTQTSTETPEVPEPPDTLKLLEEAMQKDLRNGGLTETPDRDGVTSVIDGQDYVREDRSEVMAGEEREIVKVYYYQWDVDDITNNPAAYRRAQTDQPSLTMSFDRPGTFRAYKTPYVQWHYFRWVRHTRTYSVKNADIVLPNGEVIGGGSTIRTEEWWEQATTRYVDGWTSTEGPWIVNVSLRDINKSLRVPEDACQDNRCNPRDVIPEDRLTE